MSFDFDNPRDHEKLRFLLQEISKLLCDKTELYFLITWIRVFHEVRAEYDAKKISPSMHVVKRNKAQNFSPAALSRYLVDNGISHADLAKQAGLTAAQINDICTGKREAKFGEAVAICRTLHVSLEQFIE